MCGCVRGEIQVVSESGRGDAVLHTVLQVFAFAHCTKCIIIHLYMHVITFGSLQSRSQRTAGRHLRHSRKWAGDERREVMMFPGV